MGLLQKGLSLWVQSKLDPSQKEQQQQQQQQQGSEEQL